MKRRVLAQVAPWLVPVPCFTRDRCTRLEGHAVPPVRCTRIHGKREVGTHRRGQFRLELRAGAP